MSIKEKVTKKLSQWKRSLLSSSGREVLIKVVGTAIPIYTLSCFKLLDSLLEEIHRLMINFWWGQKQNERRLAWIGWDKLYRDKLEGGLRFKDLKAFNLAMLGKQCWRLITKEHSLFYEVFKGKYFTYNSFINAKVGNNPS